MAELPTGTVTFLFTDIEGSTRLLHELGDAYADALVEHRRVLRETFANHGGVEVDTQGDAFFVAFARAKDAAAAAAEGQYLLEEGPVRVRMGIHTGEPTVIAEGYVGLDVHVGARIAAAGHGGQVLLSKAARDVAGNDLRDLGEHRLKDFDEPVWIFQLGSKSFPPLMTISNTNLPRPASSFVGRDQELQAVVSLVRDGARLLTLSGPGGSGKTRLAIEAASELVPEFKNGVFWVGLAAIRDPGLVIETIGQTLGAKEELAEHIRERELLLLLDNFEQVVDAAPQLATLVERCPNLRLLVTSRELLRVRGEVEYGVPPLADPEAVELFCARSRLDPNETIAELCRRLDNLPLAVELAAARTSVLSPAQILERLAQRLDFLKGGRDADTRHATLRTTIEWSHELLEPPEKLLFARLAVFAGGCTLEAAREVCDAEIDTLQALVEKSLVRHTNERFWMLETIREFAVDQLDRCGQTLQVQGRHARYFLDLAERAQPALTGTGRDETFWLNRLAVDYPNLRTALTWTRDSHEQEQHARLAAALSRFWYAEGLAGEGSGWLTPALAQAKRQGALRAGLLTGASYMAALQARWAEVAMFAEERLALYRRLDDSRGIAEALNDLGLAAEEGGELERARRLLEQSRAVAREASDEWMLVTCTHNLGYFALSEGDFESAAALSDDAARLARNMGDQHGCAQALGNAGLALLQLGDLDQARERLEQSLRLCRDHGFQAELTVPLEGLAAIAASTGESEQAARLLGRAEAFREETGLQLPSFERGMHDRTVETLAHELGRVAFDEARASGTDMDLDQVLASLSPID